MYKSCQQYGAQNKSFNIDLKKTWTVLNRPLDGYICKDETGHLLS